MSYKDLEDSIMQKIYDKLCKACPYAKECHEKAEECETYDDELDRELANNGIKVISRN